jgi:hypothetical protein
MYRYVIFAHHGECTQTRSLTLKGIEQLEDLGKAIIRTLGDRPYLLLHLAGKPYAHSGIVLARALGIIPTAHSRELLADEGIDALYNEMQQYAHRCTAIVLVCGPNHLDQLPGPLQSDSGGGIAVAVQPGQAVIVTVKKKEVTHLTP